MGRIIGLDVGIGSLGWAVIDEDKRRIDDLGVRIFESGEEGATKAADRASQVRRAYRANKRLNKRSKQRKSRLKRLLEKIGLITIEGINASYRTKGFNPDVWKYRAEGLNRKLTPIEIASVLINFCNYRGYQDFYEDSDEGVSASVLLEAKNRIIQKYEACKGKYSTIGEMIYFEPDFRNERTGDLIIRNRKRNGETDYKYLIDRKYLREETKTLLSRQFEYGYEMLSTDVVDEIVEVIFHQRDFEDGPGPNKETNADKRSSMLVASKGQQKYTGFDELIGKCPFYPEEMRFHKNSTLYDMYVLINDLSQFYFSRNGAEINLSESLVLHIFSEMFKNNGVYLIKDLKALCKKEDINISIPAGLGSKRQLSKAKYVAFLTNEQEFPSSFIELFASESFDNEDSLSNRIGYILAKYATPNRRKNCLKELLSDEQFQKLDYAKSIKVFKSLGVANVSAKYMKEAIIAYFNGEKYGDFQTRINAGKQEENRTLIDENGNIIPISDSDIIRNPVVCRTLNETRKIVNAIRRTYKDVTTINIEIARDIGQSFEQRKETAKYQKENETKNSRIRDEFIAKLTAEGMDVSLSDKVMNKYILWELQNHKCIYSGEDISFKEMLSSTKVQIDHIIPQSIVLDETINNKVLVLTEENQRKGNRLPCEYMDETQLGEFKNRVANLFRNGKVSKIKKEYLLLDSLDDSDVLSGFVDRNLNDTRTISKYIAVYLRQALGDSVKIQVIKGSVTSRFRQRWLKSKSKEYKVSSVYGLEQKTRDLHYYHHAIDAVVVANLTRPYIEVAQDYVKLCSMRIDSDRLAREGNAKTSLRIKESIDLEINKSIEKMKKVYGFGEDYTRNLLNNGYVPSICSNLREEVEVRVPLRIDMDVKAYEDMLSYYKKLTYLLKAARSCLKDYRNIEENDVTIVQSCIEDNIVEEINSIISLVDPSIVCIKPNGEIIREGDDIASEKDYATIEKELDSLCKKLEPKKVNEYIQGINLLTDEEYLERASEFYNDDEFVSGIKTPYISYKIDRKYRGTMTGSDNPVSLKETGFSSYKELENDINNNLKSSYYVKFNKGIGEEGNFTIYNSKKYYCLEIYLDENKKYQTRGIRYVDIRLNKKTSKMVLLKTLPDECEHVLYLFSNEYVRLLDKKNNAKPNGLLAYRSIKNINRNSVYVRSFSSYSQKGEPYIASINCNCQKIEMSILGHITGVRKCGDQSLFITERK